MIKFFQLKIRPSLLPFLTFYTKDFYPTFIVCDIDLFDGLSFLVQKIIFQSKTGSSIQLNNKGAKRERGDVVFVLVPNAKSRVPNRKKLQHQVFRDPLRLGKRTPKWPVREGDPVITGKWRGSCLRLGKGTPFRFV